LSDFKGKVIHSARWDWDYDIRNKRIGIIGNGATAAQIIPEIAKVAKSLTVFQRTPNWVIERQDTAISKPMQAVFNYVPFARRRVRAMMMDFREGFFDAIWSTESPVHDTLTKGCLEHMEKQLPGEKYKKLREQLTPKYAVGCKRVIISDDYYPTLAKENVFLETSPIHKITEKGVEVDGGEEHEFDLLVLATGFKTTQFMYPIQVYGTEGKSIEDIWSSGASAYLGMTVPELPNFSMLYGKIFHLMEWSGELTDDL
jgi:cation diffusion facilitator CzcD-associated flavoprotein CzcO